MTESLKHTLDRSKQWQQDLMSVLGVGGCISGPLQVNALYLHLGYLAVSIAVVATLAVHWNHLAVGGCISMWGTCA